MLGGHGGDVQQVELVDGDAVEQYHQGEGHGGGGDGQVPGGEGGQHAHRHGQQAPQGEHDALLKVELAGVFKGEVEQKHKGDHKADVAVGSGEEDEGAEDDLRAQDGELLVEQMVIGVGEGHQDGQGGQDQKGVAPPGQVLIALDEGQGDHEVDGGDLNARIGEGVQKHQGGGLLRRSDPETQHQKGPEGPHHHQPQVQVVEQGPGLGAVQAPEDEDDQQGQA